VYRLYPRNYCFFNNKFFDDWYFFDYWYLDVLLNFSWHFLYHFHQPSLNFLHLFYHLLNNQLLSNYLHFFYFSYHVVHLFNHLDLLDHFLYLLLCLHNRNNLFDYTINNLVLRLNMILYFSGASIFDDWNNFLDYFFNLNNLWNLYNFFDYFLDEHRHFDNLFHNCFYRNYFLNDDFYSFDFSLDVINDSINLHWNFHFHYFFSHYFNFHDLWDYLLELDDLFDDGGNLYDCLNFLLIWD
jgi:hypothetical protein